MQNVGSVKLYHWNPLQWSLVPTSVALLYPVLPLSQAAVQCTNSSCSDSLIWMNQILQSSVSQGVSMTRNGWGMEHTRICVFCKGWILDAIKNTTCHMHHKNFSRVEEEEEEEVMDYLKKKKIWITEQQWKYLWLKIRELGKLIPDEYVLFVQDLLAEEAFCQEISPPNTANAHTPSSPPTLLKSLSKRILKRAIFWQKKQECWEPWTKR